MTVKTLRRHMSLRQSFAARTAGKLDFSSLAQLSRRIKRDAPLSTSQDVSIDSESKLQKHPGLVAETWDAKALHDFVCS